MAYTEAQKKARRNYREKGKRLTVEFYHGTESDLIAHLEKQPVKGAYIKDLIRADMEKGRG